MVALGHLRKLIDARKMGEHQDALTGAEMERILKIHKSVERIIELVHERRQTLHAPSASESIFK